MTLNELSFSRDGFALLRFVDASGGYVRSARAPGSDVSDLPAATRMEIAEHWTPAVVATYQASLPPPPSVEEQRQAHVAAISAEHDRRVLEGCTVAVEGYGPIPLSGREKDKTVILGLMMTAQGMAAAGIADPILPFTDGAGTDHLLTPAQLLEMGRKGMEWVTAMHVCQRAMKAAEPLPDDFREEGAWPAA